MLSWGFLLILCVFSFGCCQDVPDLKQDILREIFNCGSTFESKFQAIETRLGTMEEAIETRLGAMEGNMSELKENAVLMQNITLLNQDILKEVADCPAPYKRVGSTCLYFHTFGTGTWNDFQSFCKGMRGNLVKVDDANLHYDIVKLITDEKLSATSFWLGGTDEGHEGDWQWTDGTHIKMGTPFWGTVGRASPQVQDPRGGTVENCLAIENKYIYLFHDYRCHLEKYGICEYGTSR